MFEKHSIRSRNCAVTYYQTLEEIPWLLMLDKPKKGQEISKNLKCNFYQEIAKIFQNIKLTTNPWSKNLPVT